MGRWYVDEFCGVQQSLNDIFVEEVSAHYLASLSIRHSSVLTVLRVGRKAHAYVCKREIRNVS